MKKLWTLIRESISRAYRLSLSAEKQDELAWNELKLLIQDADLKGGVYEKSKFIEVGLPITDEQFAAYYLQIKNREYDIRVEVISGFNPELNTDVFVLAAHFNNLLPDGQVVVNVQESAVLYMYKCDAIIPLLYRYEAYARFVNHYRFSKDIYWAFNKLTTEYEAPAIIIADLIKKIEEREASAA